jgi:N-glycosylase/DNA lyase
MKKLKVTNFNLDYTLACGQVFRWYKHEGFWFGFINRKPVKLKQENDQLLWDGKLTAKEISTYFNLDIDYIKVISTFPKNRILILALKKYWGLRIIKQEPFECLISYIMSSQNNIPRINKMVNELSRRFGKKIKFEGREVYAFPQLKDLVDCPREDVQACRLGFRDRFLDDAVTKLRSKEIKLDKIAKMSYAKANDELLKIKGVWKKVASCILLFGYNRFEAFPIDVWIERIMRKYFPGKEPSYFGKYAGYAQEYLYAFARNLSVSSR